MQTIKIKNWDKYQHYHKVNSEIDTRSHMVWFKMYADSLQDSSFMELKTNLKWIFIGLMCLACKTKNSIDYKPKWLQRTLNVRGIDKAIETLKSINFIELVYNESRPKREDNIIREYKEKRLDNKKPKLLIEINYEYLSLSNLLKTYILKNNPKALINDYQINQWTDEVRKMVELDKRSLTDIKNMIILSQEHHFWHKNVLGMHKLRKQFDRLMLEKNNKGGSYGKPRIVGEARPIEGKYSHLQ